MANEYRISNRTDPSEVSAGFYDVPIDELQAVGRGDASAVEITPDVFVRPEPSTITMSEPGWIRSGNVKGSGVEVNVRDLSIQRANFRATLPSAFRKFVRAKVRGQEAADITSVQKTSW
jgi:hypothetical protein